MVSNFDILNRRLAQMQRKDDRPLPPIVVEVERTPPAPALSDELALLTMKEAARICRVTPKTLKTWRDLPKVRLGRNFRISRSDLKQYIQSKKVTASAN